jgi:uncharacterized cupredoxin-like copper-binding protein
MTTSRRSFTITAASLLLTVGATAFVGRMLPTPAAAHGPKGSHQTFSAGEPGDAKKPARVVKVIMSDDGKKMWFEPNKLDVRRNEQIKFVLFNEGTEDHEFMLGTVAENRKHAADMKRFPDMEHDDPNAKRLSPFKGGELVWKFTKAGEFEFACLIPGHYEAGMVGKIVVK